MARSFTRREFLAMSGAAGAGAVLAACSSGSTPSPSAAASSAASSAPSASPSSAPSAAASVGGPLTFLTWSDHFKDSVLADVKTKIGVDVQISELADNIDGFNALQGGKVYDMVSGDALWVPKYYDAGYITPINLDDFEVSSQLYSMAKTFDFWTKPDGYLAYPWGWSPIQIVYDPAHVTPAPTSWEVLIDTKYAGKVVMENQPTDIMLFAGVATGAVDVYNMTDAELATAKDWLTKLKPNVYKLVQQNNETIQAMASGEAWLCTQNLGAPDRIKDAGGPETVAFVPSEGTTGFIDGEMTIRDGPDTGNVRPYLEIAAQAEVVAQNFLDNGRPLWNEKAYQVLVDMGKKDQADRYLYNQPDQALKMRLKGPAGNTEAYVNAFNEVFGG